MSETILIVDDEPQMRSVLSFALETYGFHPVSAADIASASEIIGRNPAIALVLLDIMLPDGSGLDLCERIVHTMDTPVVLLTAKSEFEERILGLKIGADDYIAKPFHPEEVILRVKKILSRRGGHGSGHLSAGGFHLDETAMRATRGGREVNLSVLEFRLFLYLVRAAGHTVSADELVREVWSSDPSLATQALVKTTVHRLRAKLAASGGDKQVIRTIRGSGYAIDL